MATPRRLSRADRRREQEAELDPNSGNVRPNEPAPPINEANRCGFGEHNFSMTGPGPAGFTDDRGSRVVYCWYCVQLSPFSQQRIAAWQETQA